VVQEDGTLVGIIGLNDVRHIMFERERYDSTLVQELMFVPEIAVEITDSVEHIARRFHETGRYNIPVLQKGKYQGFVSRANVFATYQKMLRQYSAS
jgi:CIC family chloride channel protein